MKIVIPDPPGYIPDPIHQGSAQPTERMHPTFPMPDPQTGELKIDPEVALKAKGFDLTLSLFYSTGVKSGTEWGYGRSASVAGRVDKSGSVATITRGDFGQQYFMQAGSSGGITTFVASTNTGSQTTLSYETATGEFTEYFLSGMRIVYKNHIGSGTRYEIDRVVDPSGNTHTYAYGSGAETGRLKSIEVPGGRKLTLAYIAGPSVSLVNSIEDWSGRRWTMLYDAQGFLTTFTTPLGCTTKYVYSLAGAGAGNTMVHAIEDPRGYVTTYLYNANRRVVSMAAGSAIWSYLYSPNQTVEFWPSGGRVTYNFGTGGNLVSQISADGVVHTFEYNANRIKIREQTPAGTIYSVGYDAKNRLVFSADPLGNRTTYQYDAFDNLTTLIAADGGITTYGYEGTGNTRRQIRQTDPLGRVTSFGYTAEGLLRTATDPRGLTTTNSYDSFGNLASVMHSDGGIVTNVYDVLGRLEAVTDQLGRTTTYAYDLGDHVISVRNPLNEVTTFIYDGCLLQVEINPLNERTTYTYGRFNKRTSVKNALGYVTTTN